MTIQYDNLTSQISVVGTDTNIDLNLNSKGTGNVSLNTGNGAAFKATQSFLSGTAVNYVAASGRQTGLGPVLSTDGSDTDVRFNLSSKGAGAIGLYTSAASLLQLNVLHTASAVNYLQVTGGATFGNPTISAQGSDTNIGLSFAAKNNGNSIFTGNGGTHFRIRTDIASALYFWEVFGSTAGPILRSTTTTGQIQTSGGALSFQTDTSGTTQFTVAHTASAVNFTQASGAATGGTPYFLAAGSDTNIGLVHSTKGSGSFSVWTNGGTTLQFRVADTASAVNYVQVTGAVTGGAPSILAQGSDTNIPVSLGAKGTGIVYIGGGQTRIASNNSNSLYVGGQSGAVNYVQITSSTTGFSPSFIARGSDTNVGLIFGALNDANIDFSASGDPNAGTGKLQLRVAPTTNAVNYVQVTGAATGGAAPIISTQGSDSNITLGLQSKGSAAVALLTNTRVQFDVFGGASSVNYIRAAGANTGFGPALQVLGSDTNIPLVLQPKGTGALQAQQTDSTATGGNARGANAVDWQTSRGSAGQVASGAQSVIAGGSSNTTSNQYASIAGGGSHNASGFAAAIGGGFQNTASGTVATIAGGNSNTAAGFFNFVGGGFVNSATSNSAVTTQSGTMNGTTAVTLSGSNANIKVGQVIIGTSITSFPHTYVAAISGTSLTLSQVASGSSTSTLSFYTPHGVVVGGGNNQATGSYSFIGGGGDAGTAANRNVASGDWSFVGSGKGNTASGIGAVIVGGGIGANNSVFANTASGVSSVIGGGIGHTISGQYGSTLGGAFNSISGVGSSSIAGRYSTDRSITGLSVLNSGYNSLTGLGTSQACVIVLAKQTTDATATVLTSDGGVVSTVNQVILPNNSAYYFKGTVVAGVTGAGDTASWEFVGTIKRGANAGTTALVGTPVLNLVSQDTGASTWAIALTADTTNGGLAVTVTGQASTTIRWVAKIETTEMTF